MVMLGLRYQMNKYITHILHVMLRVTIFLSTRARHLPFFSWGRNLKNTLAFYDTLTSACNLYNFRPHEKIGRFLDLFKEGSLKKKTGGQKSNLKSDAHGSQQLGCNKYRHIACSRLVDMQAR
jgi:hypothetical protein